MSHKRSGKTADPAHRPGKRPAAGRTPGEHPGERQVDESLEESFPASDPPAHVKDLPPVEGEREPEHDHDTRAPDAAEGGIGGKPVDLDDAIDSGEE